MATFYPNEEPLGPAYSFTNGICLSAASNADLRLVFNNPPVALTNTQIVSATFANTAGTSLSSGTGSFFWDRAYHNQVVYAVLPDRSSFGVRLLSAANNLQTAVLSANGYEAWGLNEIRLRNLGYF
jgi:hypothetical protein